MAKINREKISAYQNTNELIDFIALNRYEPENQDILEKEIFDTLPDYVQDIILILDFETEFEMQGLFTLTENSTGKYLTEISQSFKNTNNLEIASLITRTILVLSGNPKNNKEIEERLEEIEEQLSFYISEKDFWENVSIITDGKINPNIADL